MTTQGLPLGTHDDSGITSRGLLPARDFLRGASLTQGLTHMKPTSPPKIYLTETSQGLPQWAPFLSGATSGHLPTSGLTPQLGLAQMRPPFPKGLSKGSPSYRGLLMCGLLSLRYSLSPFQTGFTTGLPLEGFHSLRGYLREGRGGDVGFYMFIYRLFNLLWQDRSQHS